MRDKSALSMASLMDTVKPPEHTSPNKIVLSSFKHPYHRTQTPSKPPSTPSPQQTSKIRLHYASPPSQLSVNKLASKSKRDIDSIKMKNNETVKGNKNLDHSNQLVHKMLDVLRHCQNTETAKKIETINNSNNDKFDNENNASKSFELSNCDNTTTFNHPKRTKLDDSSYKSSVNDINRNINNINNNDENCWSDEDESVLSATQAAVEMIHNDKNNNNHNHHNEDNIEMKNNLKNENKSFNSNNINDDEMEVDGLSDDDDDDDDLLASSLMLLEGNNGSICNNIKNNNNHSNNNNNNNNNNNFSIKINDKNLPSNPAFESLQNLIKNNDTTTKERVTQKNSTKSNGGLNIKDGNILSSNSNGYEGCNFNSNVKNNNIDKDTKTDITKQNNNNGNKTNNIKLNNNNGNKQNDGNDMNDEDEMSVFFDYFNGEFI